MHIVVPDGYLKHGVAFSLTRWLGCLQLLWICLFSDHTTARVGPHVASLKRETEDLFYHGFDNYMKHAFPEDELRTLSCQPLTRDRANPAHIEVNDALGNYSLTLIDSLSTLAILASSPSPSPDGHNKPLLLFQKGVQDLVEQYGDGSNSSLRRGKRASGFDLDSKVQVFETAIRGLGGLLSAHLFAIGELPIRGYEPLAEQVHYAQAWVKAGSPSQASGIAWSDDFVYNGQLLRLAYDLGKRLLPAFWTPTGIPYPRVNLRDGIPFYPNAFPNIETAQATCDPDQKSILEVTETCSAGAGSLVLEFTVLSRLTGDGRFEHLGKRAFWSIWNRRSEVDLVGAGIDAETGAWAHPWTGIGAGIDSFFEYAFKSHILLSEDASRGDLPSNLTDDPTALLEPLAEDEHLAASFLRTWETAHAAIKRHFYRGHNYQHPHYIQADLYTGAARAYWIDALSAYYPGLLTLAGFVEEATETHLLTTALWTRFSALPERYNLMTGGIEGGLGWWVGRPEFIESTYYLYRATEDPWYVHVGEMVLRDIKRRCWTPCGWAGIQNVLTGEKIDRMESFFLGETAKYLFLIFDPDHPLNHLDAPFVFSTEGHPLIIPRAGRPVDLPAKRRDHAQVQTVNDNFCPTRAPPVPLTISNIAARGDVYHAASLARLHLMPRRGQVGPFVGEHAVDHPSIEMTDAQSPSNYTHYPWTLPLELVPVDAQSRPMRTRPTFDITFPNNPPVGTTQLPPLQRVKEGILINSLGGLRLAMTQDVPLFSNDGQQDGYRIHAINNVALGKDEKVFLARDTGNGVIDPTDPNFTRIRDSAMLDIVVDVERDVSGGARNATVETELAVDMSGLPEPNLHAVKSAWNALVAQITQLLPEKPALSFPFRQPQAAISADQNPQRFYLSAVTAIGKGAAPLPDWQEAPSLSTSDIAEGRLGWKLLYAADELCNQKLSFKVPQTHQVIFVKRGGCSFAQKLANIPPTALSGSSLQVVIVVSYDAEDEGFLGADIQSRPLLEDIQVTSGGLARLRPLPLIMVGGGEKTYEALKRAKGLGVKRRYSIQSQGAPITNLIVI